VLSAGTVDESDMYVKTGTLGVYWLIIRLSKRL
jgi:hypothetical protein